MLNISEKSNYSPALVGINHIHDRYNTCGLDTMQAVAGISCCGEGDHLMIWEQQESSSSV